MTQAPSRWLDNSRQANYASMVANCLIAGAFEQIFADGDYCMHKNSRAPFSMIAGG
jgi:hypothetical protein